jgi:predicted nucleotide-binding protein
LPLELRARQNVILELGFFLGRIDRKRVCALSEDGVEIPSDYDGVLFIPLDSSGAWKLDLAKEIKASGLPVDLNLLA